MNPRPVKNPFSADQDQVVCSSLADKIPGYLTRRRADVRDIERALATRDFQRIQTLGHNMKGSGSSYGFCRITEIGSYLESAAKAGARGEIDALLRDLDSYVRSITLQTIPFETTEDKGQQSA